jgi:hypothetical protein
MRWLTRTRSAPAQKPSLSLCTVSSSPAARVRAFLETWRPVVDEVVLAVDERGDTSAIEACVDLIDRAYLVPPAASYIERYLG